MVKPKAKSNELLRYDSSSDSFKVSIRAPPEKGAANRELIKYASKLVGKQVKIVSGLTSRTKKLRIS